MRHALGSSASAGLEKVSYEWRESDTWEGVSAQVSGSAWLPDEDSEEAFITEHYWGYSTRRGGGTMEYQVEHPRWQVWRADSAALRCDVASLYGADFSEPLAPAPSTAFVADGSEVLVRRGQFLK
jgi:hypothetical protein